MADILGLLDIRKIVPLVDLRMCLVLIVGQLLAYLIAHLDLVVDE